jgi:hypothetical protein
VRDAGQAKRRVVQEAFVAADVGNEDLDRIVGAAGRAVAGDDLRAGSDGALEFVHRALGVLRQVDLGEHAQRQADAFAIDDGAVAADDAGRFHRLDAFPARRRRQADGRGELLHGLARIALQRFEDRVILAVENDHAVSWLKFKDSFHDKSILRQRKKTILRCGA